MKHGTGEKCCGSECKDKPPENRNEAALEEYVCPYSEEIGDGSHRCRCCDDCRLECIYEI